MWGFLLYFIVAVVVSVALVALLLWAMKPPPRNFCPRCGSVLMRGKWQLEEYDQHTGRPKLYQRIVWCSAGKYSANVPPLPVPSNYAKHDPADLEDSAKSHYRTVEWRRA